MNTLFIFYIIAQAQSQSRISKYKQARASAVGVESMKKV